jgi:hypothetical protein
VGRVYTNCVSFRPDILVVSPDELTTHLLVEVGSSVADPNRETSLKHQMIRMGAPTGLLVTPDWVTVFRDSFKSYAEDSIARVDQVSTGEIEDLQRFVGRQSTSEAEFEDAVQNWLDQLKYRLERGYLRGSDLKFREHLLPALELGEIRATGPRTPRHVAR